LQEVVVEWRCTEIHLLLAMRMKEQPVDIDLGQQLPAKAESTSDVFAARFPVRQPQLVASTTAPPSPLPVSMQRRARAGFTSYRSSEAAATARGTGRRNRASTATTSIEAKTRRARIFRCVEASATAAIATRVVQLRLYSLRTDHCQRGYRGLHHLQIQSRMRHLVMDFTHAHRPV